MKKVFAFIGATVGSAIGWWLGAFAGTMTAFFLSVLGTALGVWLGHRWADEYLG